MGSRHLHRVGCAFDLEPALDGAGTRDNGDPWTTDRDAADLDNRALRPDFAACQLEGPQHRHHALDPGLGFEMGQRMGFAALLPDAGHDRAFDAGDHMGPVIERLDHPDHIFDIGGAGVGLHHDNHAKIID